MIQSDSYILCFDFPDVNCLQEPPTLPPPYLLLFIILPFDISSHPPPPQKLCRPLPRLAPKMSRVSSHQRHLFREIDCGRQQNVPGNHCRTHLQSWQRKIMRRETEDRWTEDTRTQGDWWLFFWPHKWKGIGFQTKNLSVSPRWFWHDREKYIINLSFSTNF